MQIIALVFYFVVVCNMDFGCYAWLPMWPEDGYTTRGPFFTFEDCKTAQKTISEMSRSECYAKPIIVTIKENTP